MIDALATIVDTERRDDPGGGRVGAPRSVDGGAAFARTAFPDAEFLPSDALDETSTLAVAAVPPRRPSGTRSTPSSSTADPQSSAEPGYHRAPMEGVTKRAEELLAEVPDWIWDGESLPVPVEDIADSHFGLLVRDVEDMTEAPGCPSVAGDQSISGLLLPSRGEIWVNADEARQWPPRRRFTIGHELGHWVLHQDEQTSLFCRHGSVGEPDDDSAEGRRGSRPRPDRGAGQLVRRLAADAGRTDPPPLRARPAATSTRSARSSTARAPRWAGASTR